MKKWIIFVLIFAFQNVNAYVFSKTNSGANIKWQMSEKSITMYANPNPLNTFYKTSTLSNDEVMSILNASVAQWNSASPYKIQVFYSDQNIPLGQDVSFRFSDDATMFGSGVVAVTQIGHNPYSGEILSADILINESYSNGGTIFTDSSFNSANSYAYLGDVITHELGHLLGLSHSEVIGSSMNYAIFKDQSTVSQDDIAGIRDLYDSNALDGAIKGKVVAGENAVAIFGTHVQLISTSTNEVVQGQLTDENGEFFFDNLNINDSYYVFISELKNLDDISNSSQQYYQTIRNDFCSGGDFIASFYTKCGPRNAGQPQLFKLDSNQSYLDIGNISLRCKHNISQDYYIKKSDNESFSLSISANGNAFSHVGLFSDLDISNGLAGNGDKLQLDLSHLDNVGGQTYQLSVKSTGIGSAFDTVIKVKRTDASTYSSYYSTTNSSSGKLETDRTISLALSSSSSANIFDIEIYPIQISSSQGNEIFANVSKLQNVGNQYVLIGQIGDNLGSTFDASISSSNLPDTIYYEDNMACLEGNAQYTVSAYTPLSSFQPDEDDQAQTFSCATVDFDGGNGGNGPLSLVFGILLFFTLSSLKKKSDFFV